jgi:NADH dehydrogenase
MITMTQPGQGRTGGRAPQVVVVGAGFAGLAAVRRLARAGVHTTLIDRNVHATFQPLLYQVATGGLASGDVAYPLRAAARRYGAVFRHGELAGVDPAARQVTLADDTRLDYDYLILATGVAVAYHGIPGAAEHTVGLYTRRDAIALRDHIIASLDQASRDDGRDDVTVTVIGGGPTGVELAGTLADLRAITLPALFPEIDPERVHITLIDRSPALLPPFHPALRDYTRRQLERRGVKVLLGTVLAEIAPDKIQLADGTALPSDITVWAAGVAAPAAAGEWGLPQDAGGRIVADPDLRVAGQDRIFAAGDIALTGGQPLPQLAQPALQMGRHAAGQIRRLEAGQPTVPFRYRDKGIMATIGYRSAVIEFPHRVRARGIAAWLGWLALHLLTLPGGHNRISALISLSWRYLTWRHGGGGIIGDHPPAAPGMTTTPRDRAANGSTSTWPVGSGTEPALRRTAVHVQLAGGIHIGRADGLRRRAFRLQERVGYPVAESQQAGPGQCCRQSAAPPDGVG